MNKLEKMGLQELKYKLFAAQEKIARLQEKKVPEIIHLGDDIKKALEIADSLSENDSSN